MARVYGIDLGAYSVKVVVVMPGFRHSTVTHVLEQTVPKGDQPYEVRAAGVIGTLIRAHSLEHDTPYAALSGDQVFLHVLEFPFKTMQRQNLGKAVAAELEGRLPVDLEDMVYDFAPLSRSIGEQAVVGAGDGGVVADPAFTEPTATATQNLAEFEFTKTMGRGPVAPKAEGMRVLACAARLSRAEELLEHFGSVNAEPRGLIAAPAAYERLAERISAFETSKGGGPYTAFIDLGHLRTDVCVVIDGRTNYARTIGRGGSHVTQAIAQAWKLPYADAERAKHADGFIASRRNPAPNQSWQHVHQVVYQEMAPLARELRRTLTACRAKTGAIVSRAVLVGGGSRLKGVSEFLTEELNIDVTLITKEDDGRLLGEQLAPHHQSDIFALAAGVSFEGATGRPNFDLRQGPLAYKADLSFLRAKSWSIAAGALAVLLFVGFAGWMENYKLKKAEAVLDERLAQESQAVFNTPMTADEVLAKVSPSGGSKSPIPKTTAYDVLLALNAALPSKKEVKIDIEEIDIKPGKVTIRKAVSAPSGEHKPLKGIELFETNLQKSDCFKQFSDPDKKPGPEDTQQFSMTIEVDC
jgi:general secretion pathway protein L